MCFLFFNEMEKMSFGDFFVSVCVCVCVCANFTTKARVKAYLYGCHLRKGKTRLERVVCLLVSLSKTKGVCYQII